MLQYYEYKSTYYRNFSLETELQGLSEYKKSTCRKCYNKTCEMPHCCSAEAPVVSAGLRILILPR